MKNLTGQLHIVTDELKNIIDNDYESDLGIIESYKGVPIIRLASYSTGNLFKKKVTFVPYSTFPEYDRYKKEIKIRPQNKGFINKHIGVALTSEDVTADLMRNHIDTYLAKFGLDHL